MDLLYTPGSESPSAPASKKHYDTPRLESYGDATEITRSLDVNKIDDVDIAGNGSLPHF